MRIFVTIKGYDRTRQRRLCFLNLPCPRNGFHCSLPPTDLRRLCFYTCLSFCSRRGVVSQHALQVSRSTPRGELRGLAWEGVSRPTARGNLRGLACGGFSRPTPRGGKLRGLAWGGFSRPTPMGVSHHALRQTAPIADGSAAGGTHPTGMHSCLQSKVNW